MSNKRIIFRQGLTLIEMTTVVAILAILTGIGISVIPFFLRSLAQVNAANLSVLINRGCAIAAKEQSFAGVCFQTEGDEQYGMLVIEEPNDPDRIELRPYFRDKERVSIEIGIASLDIIKKQTIDDNDRLVFLIFSPQRKIIRKTIELYYKDEIITSDTDIGYVTYNLKEWENYKKNGGPFFSTLKSFYFNLYTGQIISAN
jgi:prepilin-type N-terminal cleavage/methylation domain-containing protein